MAVVRLDRDRYVLGDASAHVGFLNCERIAERSHIHDWVVEPHYHDGLAQLFVFDTGHVDALIDTVRQPIEGPALVWLPALCSHAFNYPLDMRGFVLTVPSVDVARLAKRSSWMASWSEAPQILQGPPHRSLLLDALQITERLERDHQSVSEARSCVLEAQFLLLLACLHRGVTLQAANPARSDDRRNALVRRFQDLLEQHMPEPRSVADYADRLSVTPTHLSRVTRAVTGKTAAEIIHDRILLEAKRRLAFSDLPVSEIAYALKFSSPSYFSRFFTARAGETPKAFREHTRLPAPSGNAA